MNVINSVCYARIFSLGSLNAIVAQCLASILQWKISVIPSGLTQEKMFDLDLYGLKTDEQKKSELKSKIERDQFLSYIVNAIKYAAGEGVFCSYNKKVA